jgi:hypothetical protein
MARHRRLGLCALLVAGSIAVSLPATAHASKKTQSVGKSRARSCSGGILGFSPIPAIESGALDPEVASQYAVLRRPAGPEDQLPPINPLGEDLTFQLRSYFPGYIRQIAVDPDGDRYFLVVGFERGFAIPPARCLPRQLRRDRAQLVAEQRARERRLIYCVEDIGPHRPRYPELNCQPFAGDDTGENLISTAQSTSEVTELVPDGVTTVRLVYRSGAVITTAVSNNAFTFTPPQGPIKKAMRQLQRFLQTLRKRHARPSPRLLREFSKHAERAFDQLPPTRVEWLGANGELVRAFVPRAKGRSAGGSIIGIN